MQRKHRTRLARESEIDDFHGGIPGGNAQYWNSDVLKYRVDHCLTFEHKDAI